jgi:ribonuclease-3
VYVARGIEGAREVGGLVVGDPLARLAESRTVGRDAKSELQEQVQAEGSSSPRYRVLGTEGPDHRRAFHVGVEVDGAVIGEGRGRSKKLAEQAAARAAIEARTNPPTGTTTSAPPPSNEPLSSAPPPGPGATE